MRLLTTAMTVTLVWAVIAGVLSAYIRCCFRFRPDRQHFWREVMRRAGIFPLLLLGIVASQLLVNQISTPFDPKNFVLAFIIVWIIPPVIVLVEHITLSSRSAPLDVVLASVTDDRAVSTASALITLVVTAVISAGVWLILARGETPANWIGAVGLMPSLATLTALYLLTRRAERSISNHAVRTHHLGLLWSIGIALMALQSTAVAWRMGVMTYTIGI